MQIFVKNALRNNEKEQYKNLSCIVRNGLILYNIKGNYVIMWLLQGRGSRTPCAPLQTKGAFFYARLYPKDPCGTSSPQCP